MGSPCDPMKMNIVFVRNSHLFVAWAGFIAITPDLENAYLSILKNMFPVPLLPDFPEFTAFLMG